MVLTGLSPSIAILLLWDCERVNRHFFGIYFYLLLMHFRSEFPSKEASEAESSLLEDL